MAGGIGVMALAVFREQTNSVKTAIVLRLSQKKLTLFEWDQFCAHRTEDIIHKLNQLKTQLAIIPEGLTRQFQSLDVSINKPLKGFIKENGTIGRGLQILR